MSVHSSIPKIYTLIFIIIAMSLCLGTLFVNINPLIFVIALEGYNICYILFIYICKTDKNTVKRLLMLSMLIFTIMAFGLCLININPIIGKILILLGLFFKLSVVPFHSWLPDVYEHSLFSTVATTETFKIALVSVFVHILPIISYCFISAIHVMGYFSLIIGAILALREQNVKRWLGYLSVGHVGIMMCIANHGTTIDSILITGLKYIVACGSCVVIFCVSKNSILRVLTILGMIGLPPSHTFFVKIDLVKTLLKENNICCLSAIITYFIFELISAIYWIKFYLTSKSIPEKNEKYLAK